MRAVEDLEPQSATGLNCVFLTPGGQQLLNEGLCLLLFVAAAARNPLGKGVKRVLVGHGKSGASGCCHLFEVFA